MSQLQLVIGNKNYSSWSLRPWFLLKRLAIPFQEIKLSLDTPAFAAQIGRYSPTGRVPVLIDGTGTIWESLAICEYLAERCPDQGAWPADPATRAHARSAAHEMHAGFAALRNEFPMNCRARRAGVVPSPAASADIARIAALWTECRRRHGAAGPWLYGEFTIADAMYAPVVLRFHTYGRVLPALAASYVAHVLDDPAIRSWVTEARSEREVIERSERGSEIQ